MTRSYCLLETWQPEPTKTLVGESPVKEGKTLAKSITEDVSGIGFLPKYSNKKLRKIHRTQSKYSEFLMMNTFATGGTIQW